MKPAICLVVFCSLLCLPVPVRAERSPERKTEYGRVRGIALEASDAFLGIPYAASTEGPGRWMPPAPAHKWTGVRDAIEYGLPCPQGKIEAFSENCLTLNVWQPRNGKTGLPVLFFIHGGANSRGAEHFFIYDGKILAEQQQVVVVTIRYRLGILGYFAHPELTKLQGKHTANYGTMDQIAALQWARRNIANFGGDPNKITVVGESAGGNAILTLLASPLNEKYFRAGIAESPWLVKHRLPDAYVSLKEGERRGTHFASQLHCADLKCLRSLSAEQIVRFQDEHFLVFFPVTEDTSIVPQPVLSRIQRGQYLRIPLILGANAREIATRFFTDFVFDCTIENYLNSLSARTPVYSYEFARRQNGFLIPMHGTELPYVFGTLRLDVMDITEARDIEISNEMMRYWGNFVKDPNQPPWRSYKAASPFYLSFEQRVTYPKQGSRCHSR